MNVYLDTSVLMSLAIVDSSSDRGLAFVGSGEHRIIVSDLGLAEVASATSRLVRMSVLSAHAATTSLLDLRGWTMRAADRELIKSADLSVAEAALSRLDLPLKTADAIHVAVALRIGAALATFDRKQAASARVLGSVVIEP